MPKSVEDYSVEMARMMEMEDQEQQRELMNQWFDEYDAYTSAYEMESDIGREIDASIADIDSFQEVVEEARDSAEDIDAASKRLLMEDGIPLSNDEIGELAFREVKENTPAQNAAYIGQHPIKYAFAATAAAIRSIGDIPREIKQQRELANAAGIDARTSLEKAAQNITAGAKGIVIGENSIPSKACNVYKDAVDKLQTSWQKAKESIANGMAKAMKGFDMGMEWITRGDWSRYCLTNDKIIERDMALGDKFSAKLHNFMTSHSFHNKLAGISYSYGEDGKVQKESSAYEYWNDIKTKVWSDEYKGTQIGRSDALGKRDVNGPFGVTSPMDVRMAKISYKHELRSKMFNDAKEQVIADVKVFGNALANVGREMKADAKELGNLAAKGAKAVKDKVATGANKVKDTMLGLAMAAGAVAMEGVTAARVGTLRMAAKACDKVALVERSAERRAHDKFVSSDKEVGKTYEEYQNAVNNTIKAEQNLDKLERQVAENAPEARKFEFSESKQQFRGQMVQAAQDGIAMAKPMALMMNAQEKLGDIKAAVGSVVDKVAYNLKSNGILSAQKEEVDNLRWAETVAHDDFDKAWDKMSKYQSKEAARGDRAQSMEDKAQALRDKADALAGKGKEEDALDIMEGSKADSKDFAERKDNVSADDLLNAMENDLGDRE